MALPFIPSDAVLLTVQAWMVAVPRRPPGVDRLARLAGRGWAVIPLGSLVVVVFAIRYVSDTATGLTYLALVAVPPLAAIAVGWAMRSARVAFALPAAGALFAIAWVERTSLSGELAAALLSGLSCVTLAVLLAAVTPATWLKAGILAMAVADTWLVVSDLLQAPNATLIAAHPGNGLPSLQSELFGTVSLGYGDLFAAALLGATLANELRRQRTAAVLVLALSALFDLLFLVVSELPATVPVALAMLSLEAWDLRARRRGETGVSGRGRPWRRGAATPPRAT